MPVPWSVPAVPLMRAVRPNSVATTITVSRQRAPRPVSNSASAPSSPPSNCASRPTGPPSLAWVSQPSKASAAIRGPSSADISLAAPRATSFIAPALLVPGFGFMSSPCAALSSCKPCVSAVRQRGIAVPVEFDQARRGILGGLRQRDRRPGDGRRGTAQHQRRGRTDGKTAHHPLAPRQRFQRAVEPAGLHPARPGKTAFEHVLAVEMRAVAIRRRHRVNHRGVLLRGTSARIPASRDAARRRNPAGSRRSGRSMPARSIRAGRHNRGRRSAPRWRGHPARRAG